MKKKKDNPSNFSVYFLCGCEAFKDGLPITALPHEISLGDTYSEYLRRAWIAGWKIEEHNAKELAR